MVLALMAEAHSTSRHYMQMLEGVPPLGHFPEFTAVARLCARREFDVAQLAGLTFKKDAPEASDLMVKFANGVEHSLAITAELGWGRAAFVGHPTRHFCPVLVGRAITLLAGACPREWGIRPKAPTHGGRIGGPTFRAFAAAMRGVDGNHPSIDLVYLLFAEGGADVFFVQPG